jgi:hypothetical protein
MRRVLGRWVLVVWAGLMVSSARPAAAQADRLALVFEDIFGPNGLVVNSEAVLPDGSTHSAHFNSAFQSNFTQFNIALASQLTALPLPSPASGFTYRFDASTGTFARSTQSFGPILTDRAETIGRGRFSFGFNYQQFTFDRLEDIDLDRVPAVFTHDDFQLGGGRADVVTTDNFVRASVGQMTSVLTYGVTDRFDISLAVPMVRTTLEVSSHAAIQRVGTGGAVTVHFFRDADASGGIGNTRDFQAGGTASGVGDLILRAKHTLMREGHRGLALGLDARVPTGDERDLLGSGAVGMKPFAALSLSYGRVSPHVNLAYQWNGESLLGGDLKTGQKGDLPDQFLYAVGADMGVNDKFSLTADVLGRRTINSPRVRERTFVAHAGGVSESFDDIEFFRDSFTVTNGSVGCKANVAGSLLVNFNLRFALDHNGLTDRVTPLVGIEYGF